jgi:shikimate kinase
MRKNCISIIGFMGCGKTVVGKELSMLLGYRLIDLDEEIVKTINMPIKDFFSQFGEEQFREIESLLLKQLLGLPNSIIACGGGIVLSEQNRHLLKSKSTVVWLHNPIKTSINRIKDDSRPLLNVANKTVRASTLLRKRMPLYKECSEIIKSTELLTPAMIAEQIIESLQNKKNTSKKNELTNTL